MQFNSNLKYLLPIFLCSISAQSFFSTVTPINNVSENARTASLGGSNIEDSYFNPSSGSFGSRFQFSLGLEFRAHRETRSYPAIDMFEDVVTQNTYVINRDIYESMPWKIGIEITDYIKIPISFTFGQKLFWDNRFDYQEEVRGNLGSGVYNRDPVVGYHIYNMDGVINSNYFNIAILPWREIQFGVTVERLIGDNLSHEIGVNVIQTDEALSADTTTLAINSYSSVVTNRVNLGLILPISKAIKLGFTLRQGLKVDFTSSNYLPLINERTQLPGLTITDSSSSFSILVPTEYELGFSMRSRNKIRSYINGNIKYSDRGTSDAIIIVNNSGNDSLNLKLKNTLHASIGIEHWIFDKAPFRFGFSYLGSPINDELERTIFSIGTGWVFEEFVIDISTTYGRVGYQYEDLFPPLGQDNGALETVSESSFKTMISLNYAF